MKLFNLLVVLLVPFALAKTINPPDTIVIVRPDPKKSVTRGTRITIGIAEGTKQVYGLVKNITMWYKQPDGSNVPLLSYGEPYTNPDGSIRVSGYNPQECRSMPGARSTADVFPGQAGIYTFFWNTTYAMSSDPTKANTTWCGPDPFSIQSWLINSTVGVIDTSMGPSVSASLVTTTTRLPSKPTGKVNSAVGGISPSWGVAFALMGAGVGMLA